mmetsp:Transcript_27151/g.74459  ORF Transcript_27151/g.74459 Transcript_27151/m.74459 type:complete len:291 (+) Transcript_27151:676-1548(+)
MKAIRRRAIPPVDGHHFRDVGVVDVRESLEVASNVRASVVERQKVGVFARQDRVPSVHRDPVHVHSPAPGHGQPAPPDIVIEVHPHQPPGVPVVQMKVLGGDHGKHEKKDRQCHFRQLDAEDPFVPGPEGVRSHQQGRRNQQHQRKDPQFPRPQAVHLKERDAVLQEPDKVLALKVEIGQDRRPHPRQVVDAGFFGFPQTADHEKDDTVPYNQIGLVAPNVDDLEDLVPVVKEVRDKDVDNGHRHKGPEDKLEEFGGGTSTAAIDQRVSAHGKSLVGEERLVQDRVPIRV